MVDLGLPSGTLWATRDIDLTKASKFADTPFVYEVSFFSWGNIDGHNPTSPTSFDGSYDWGGINEDAPYYEGQVYGSTPGAELTTSFTPGSGHDAARENLGAPWRIPSAEDFIELMSNVVFIDADGNDIPEAQTSKMVTVNGIVGVYLRSVINGNKIFFACSGYGSRLNWLFRGLGGRYTTSDIYNPTKQYMRFFYIGVLEGTVYISAGPRYDGRVIRPVQSGPSRLSASELQAYRKRLQLQSQLAASQLDGDLGTVQPMPVTPVETQL